MKHLLRIAALALALSLPLGAPVAADQFEDGLAAYNIGDYATALKLWQPLADQGDAEAQNYLGNMYAAGYGVPQDYAEAMMWYRMAADQGLAFAQHNLGNLYYKGEGVPQDYAEAVKWYRMAADQGYAMDQANLGGLYIIGQGVPEDYVLAYMWLSLAASGGSKEAIEMRNSVEQLMTYEQIDEAEWLAQEWKPQ